MWITQNTINSTVCVKGCKMAHLALRSAQSLSSAHLHLYCSALRYKLIGTQAGRWPPDLWCSWIGDEQNQVPGTFSGTRGILSGNRQNFSGIRTSLSGSRQNRSGKRIIIRYQVPVLYLIDFCWYLKIWQWYLKNRSLRIQVPVLYLIVWRWYLKNRPWKCR